MLTQTAFSAKITTEAQLEYNRGVDFYKLGQYDRAITAFRQAINLSPDYVDAYYNLGLVLEYLQQYDEALTVFKQIIVRKPDDYEAVYKAALISTKMGELEKARNYLMIIPKSSPQYFLAEELAEQYNLGLTPTSSAAIEPSGVHKTSGLYEHLLGPTGITMDKLGNVYIACFSDNSIMKITPSGERMVFAKSKLINGPIGLAIDASGNIYVANYGNNNVLKISKFGAITVQIANLQKPYGVYIDGNMLFISCQGSNSVLRYKLVN